MQVFTNRDQLIQAVGTELGTSDWLTITQEQVDLFAQATGDHQWIHVDRERAASGPFGGTIAHGYLTASLLPVLTQQIFKVEAKMGINYGLNKLRFPAPVPVGSSVRAYVDAAGSDRRRRRRPARRAHGRTRRWFGQACRGRRVGEQVLLVRALSRWSQPRVSRGMPSADSARMLR